MDGKTFTPPEVVPAPKEFKPVCIWCNAPWSDANVEIEAYSGGAGCDTCGYGSEPYGSVKIVCHECDRLMYQKDF